MKKWTKKEKTWKIKSKKKDKKREKQVGKKGKECPKEYLPLEMGPKIDFARKNCQEKS